MKEVRINGTNSDDFRDQFIDAINICNTLLDEPEDDKILIDLSNAKWFGTAFIAPLSCIINVLESRGRDIKIEDPNDNRAKKHLNKIGFPRGYKKVKVKDKRHHLPLCRLDSESSTSTIDVSGERIRELLLKHHEELPSNNIDGVYYPISELIDNMEQHSRCTEGSLLAQYYPKKKFFDFSVCDNGISIPGSFKEYNIEFNDDLSAIKMAVEDGVSTKETPGSSSERGCGLRSIRDMVVNGLSGKLLMISNKGAIFIDQKDVKTTKKLYWPGTMVAARLKVPKEGFEWTKYV